MEAAPLSNSASVVDLDDPFRCHRRQVPALHILVVSEQASSRMLLETILRKAGHHPYVFDNPDAALDCLTTFAMEVLVLDIHGQEMSSKHFMCMVQLMHATRRPAPALFLTADRSSLEARDANEAGAAALLYKPLQAQALLQAIAQVAPVAATVHAPPEPPRKSQVQLLRESRLDEEAIAEYVRMSLQDLASRRQHLETLLFSTDSRAWAEACEAIRTIAAWIEADDLAKVAANLGEMAADDGRQRLAALRSLDCMLDDLQSQHACIETDADTPAFVAAGV